MQKEIPAGKTNETSPGQGQQTQLRRPQSSAPQSGALAQLAALVNHSPHTQTQRRLAHDLESSSQIEAQRSLSAEINAASPPPAAQFKRMEKKTAQTKGKLDEKKPKQPKTNATAQAKRKEEKHPAQSKEKEKPRQAKSAGGAEPAQRVEAPSPNRTGLPDQLKSGIENLSGQSFDNVKVHYNSQKPAQLNALAYAQGSDIHIAPGQEKHLPHEAWHVVQQQQGRVKPTTQAKGVAVNDEPGLEREADVMGARATTAQRREAGVTAERAGTTQRRKAASLVSQRVEVSTARQGNEHLQALSSDPLQMVTVTTVRPGTRISQKLLEEAIKYVTTAVQHAEDQEGKKSSGEEHKRLTSLLANEATTKPKSNRETFGLGGSQYFPGHPFTTTQGTQEFGASVATIADVGSTEHLGKRPTGLHDEMHQITQYPGLQALASTQGHCIFCYGTIHGRGYQHGEIREDPFPQNWIHDYAGFGLKESSAKMDSIEYSDCPVIKIESTFGTKYYYVSKG